MHRRRSAQFRLAKFEIQNRKTFQSMVSFRSSSYITDGWQIVVDQLIPAWTKSIKRNKALSALVTTTKWHFHSWRSAISMENIVLQTTISCDNIQLCDKRKKNLSKCLYDRNNVLKIEPMTGELNSFIWSCNNDSKQKTDAERSLFVPEPSPPYQSIENKHVW